MPQINVSRLLEKPTTLLLFGCLCRNLSSRQVASTIHDSRWLLPGQERVFPTSLDSRGDGRRLRSIHSLTRNGAGDCQAGEGDAVTLNRHRQADVSQRSLSPSTAGKQRNRFTGDVHKPKAIMLKNK